MSEKTHQPTAKKLREAKEKGQTAKSKLFSSATVTLAGLAATFAFCGESWNRFLAWTSWLLATHDTSPQAALSQGVRLLMLGAAPTLLAAFAGALLSAGAMSGLQFNPTLVSPKLERIDFTQGLKKLVSARHLLEVLKGMAVAAIIVWVFWSGLETNSSQAASALHHSGAPALAALLALLSHTVLQAALLLAVLGAGDWALARRRHLKDLLMSHEELKQEHKNSEGDPHQKAKRKSLHRQLASGGPARGVQQASAVVVNPTHIAVALRYAEDECDAPYIVARAREEAAVRLRTQAQELGIPVVRDVSLARSLIHYDLGEEVPEELYQAAAALLKVALKMTESKGAQAPR